MCSRSRRTRSMTRRSGTKTRRRPKYLSLRRQLNRPDLPAMPALEISDHHDRDPNLTCLLDDHDGGGAALAALLGGGDVLAGNHDTLSSPSPASSSMNDEDELARRALRGRERLMFCSSTASSSSLDEVNVSSCKVFDLMRDSPSKTLSLKLDYDEILTAWSDRGSLYMEGEASQVVPEIYDGTVFVEMGSNGNAWRVPEVKVEKGEEVKVDQGKGVVESREARVMRYKEKRRRRLFAKRIRYEVRKLNAEKRPRMKGRFVKRQDDE